MGHIDLDLPPVLAFRGHPVCMLTMFSEFSCMTSPALFYPCCTLGPTRTLMEFAYTQYDLEA